MCRMFFTAPRSVAGTIALLSLCLWPSAAHADIAITKVNTPLEDVSGKCSLTTVATDKSVSVRCRFSNKSQKVIRFVLCVMTDLNSARKQKLLPGDNTAFKDVPAPVEYKLTQVGGEEGTLKCNKVEGALGASSAASIHFGCQLVELQPGEQNHPVPYGSVKGYKVVTKNVVGPPQEKEVPFNSLKADDFEVSYTDQIDLTSTPKKKFDDASCKPAVGQQNFIDYDTDTIEEGVRSRWSFEEKAFIDPFVQFQRTPLMPRQPCDADGDGIIDLADIQAIFAARNQLAAPGDPRDVDHDGLITVNDARICTLRTSKQYTLYSDPPCLPPGVPATVPDLPVCPAPVGTPPGAKVDLNLFSFYTETSPPGTLFPAVLDVQTDGDAAGLRLETTPPAGEMFNMMGVIDLVGQLRVCASSSLTVCAPPKVSEGRVLDVTVDVNALDPDVSFAENGRFIQDTEPPKVLAHSVTFDSGGNLIVDVTAFDATTSPVGADFWFSIDGGVSWDRATLDATTDILLDDLSTRTFTGNLGPLSPGVSIQYFIAVKDVVSNIVYFGLDQAGP